MDFGLAVIILKFYIHSWNAFPVRTHFQQAVIMFSTKFHQVQMVNCGKYLTYQFCAGRLLCTTAF
jgi:hypothetical protein